MNKKLALPVALVLLVAAALNLTSSKVNDNDLAKTTAMITNLAENSGGTGVVYRSSNTESTIITNAHVCGVVKNGGVVHTQGKKTLVASYKVSEVHDLCMITVHNNLHASTDVASSYPAPYSTAIVSGHPALYPTIVTHGHFSDKVFIHVMTGMRPCEKEDLEGPNMGMCLFLGGIPVIKLYEAVVVTPTIMPGSSGSAIFNEQGKIAGLIFAGQGNLGYGLGVPQEYVKNFVDNEVDNLKKQIPSVFSGVSQNDSEKKIRDVCKEGNKNTNYTLVKDLCEYTDLIYTNE